MNLTEDEIRKLDFPIHVPCLVTAIVRAAEKAVHDKIKQQQREKESEEV